MNCWRTVNFSKQYGAVRLFILSCLTALATFVVLYVLAAAFVSQSGFYDNYFLLFILGMIAIYPVHKLLHFLPVMHLNTKIKKSCCMRFWIFPVITLQITDPVSKLRFLCVVLMPFCIINGFLAAACLLFPHYTHYFIMLIAYHTGLCFFDLVMAKNVMNAPTRSYIEEHEDSLEILLQRH